MTNALRLTIKDLSVLQKLITLGVCAFAPVLVVAVFYWRAATDDIRFAERELAGVDYVESVWPIMRAAALASNNDRRRQRRLDAFQAQRAAQDASLNVAAEAGALADALESGTDSDHAALAAAAAALIAKVGDTSNLILDPDLDSYYAMDLIVLSLPRLALAADTIRTTAAAGDVDGRAGIQAIEEIARLDSAIDGVIQSIDRAALYAPGFESETVGPARTNLAFARADLDRTIADIEASTLAGRPAPRDRAAELESIAFRVLATADTIWGYAAQDLRQRLRERIERERTAIYGAISLALFALALTTVLIVLLSRSIVAPLERLRSAALKISAGDVRTIVPDRLRRNELGDMANAIEKFRSVMIERQMLERNLEDERASLERAVEARTADLAAASELAKERSRLLTLALKTVGAGIWTVSRQNRVFWSSAEVEEICGKGFDTNDFEDGVWDLVHPDDRQFVANGNLEAREGRPLYRDFRIVRADGRLVWINVSSMLREDGTWVGIMLDITERKQQEMRLAEARVSAEAASRAKSAFLASMSHEIRTPLNGVLGMAAALARTQMRPEQKEMVDVINESGTSLMIILNDVLDISKIESGKLELERTAFGVGEAVEAVAALFTEVASAKNLTLDLDIDHLGDLKVVGDPVRLRQVLQNFVSNAVKFTAAGSVRVRAWPLERGLDDALLRFEVIDTGIGMTADQQGRVFQSFAQADSSITRRYGGTGLGLSICQQLAQLMGGDVGCMSAPGEGSTFWLELRLPYAGADAAIDDEDDLLAVDLSALRILAADDNATNRLVLKTILNQFEMSPDFVTNGQEAVDAAAQRPYDLILMDIHMPQMDGRTAARTIRAGDGPNARTPIIALTADVMPEHVRAYLADGMTAHVGKPIRPEMLFAAIIDAAAKSAGADAADWPGAATAA
jgi:PAS domain S-box-containing protein